MAGMKTVNCYFNDDSSALKGKGNVLLVKDSARPAMNKRDYDIRMSVFQE
jgi:hypothetical protein